MRILYSAGSRKGSAYPLKYFVENCKYEVKVAAYLKSGFLMDTIDWVLDAIPLPGDNPFFRDSSAYKILLSDIDYYEPDLIICDNEPHIAEIAQSFGIKLWYCSPIYLSYASDFIFRKYEYRFRYPAKQLENLPDCAEKILVYSPFGDIVGAPALKQGFDWVQPYHYNISCAGEGKTAIIDNDGRTKVLRQILKSIPGLDINIFDSYSREYMEDLSKANWAFNTGYTTCISDTIYGGITKMCIAPYFQDEETLLNAELCRALNIGENLGQVELMEGFAIHEVEKSILSLSEKKYTLKNTRNKFLHELVEQGESLCI